VARIAARFIRDAMRACANAGRSPGDCSRRSTPVPDGAGVVSSLAREDASRARAACVGGKSDIPATNTQPPIFDYRRFIALSRLGSSLMQGVAHIRSRQEGDI